MKLKLKDICVGDGKYGIPASAIPYDSKKYRYLRITDISDDGFLLDNDKKSLDAKDSSQYLLIPNDIVFARTGNSTGRSFFYEQKYGDLVYAGFLIKFHLDSSKINPRFMKYYTISKQYKYWVKCYQDGSTRGNMSAQSFLNLPIPSVTRKQQDNMVKIFDVITEKIQLNNTINQQLEQFATTLYNYWFIQFDFPDEFGRPYKSSGGKMVYNEVLKREIPVGWHVENFYNNTLSKIIQPGIEPFVGNKTYLPTASVQGDQIVDFSNTITFRNRESRANMAPLANSIWFAKMKNSKKVIFIGDYSKEYIDNFIFSTGFCGLHCSENSLEYIWNTINSPYFEARKDILAHGATQEAIRNEDLISIPLLVPSCYLLNLYHQKTKKLYYQKYIKEIENNVLIQLRDFLLPMLMNGQITVKS